MRKSNNTIKLLLWILALLLLNVLSERYHAGIDLTAERRFTLSPSTKNLVTSINEPLKLTVYLDGNLPTGFKKLAGRAEDIAAAFRSISKGKFLVEFERPGAGLTDTAKAMLYDSLQLMGIHPTNVKAQQKTVNKRRKPWCFLVLS